MSSALTAGCASLLPQSAPQKSGPICETATAHGTTTSATLARAYARQSLAYQVGEVAGFLRAIGATRIDIGRERIDCQPYLLPVATGLTRCVASAPVCGN